MARQNYVVLVGFNTHDTYYPVGARLQASDLRKEVLKFLLGEGAIAVDSGETAPDADDTEEEGAEVADSGGWLRGWSRSNGGDAAPDSDEALTEEDDGQDR